MDGSTGSASRLPRSARREAILDAVAEIVAQRSVDAISMTDVVRVAGVSRPVVYDHFPATADVMVALVERARGALSTALRAHKAEHGAVEDEAGFRAVLGVIFSHAEQDPAGWRLIAQDPSADETVASAQLRAREEVNRAIADALGLPGPPRTRMLLAETIRAGASGLHVWGLEHASLRRRQLVDAFVAVTWRGIGR